MKTTIIATALLGLLINVASSQSRIPLSEDQITLPDYIGIFAIDGGQPMELTKPMDDFNSEPCLEITPMVEFVFFSAGPNRRLIRILSQEEFNQRTRRRAELANARFTWDNFNSLINMQTAEFAKAMDGVFANEEIVQMMNKLVDDKPTMIRQIPAQPLSYGNYRIGDGRRWYKITVVQNPKREPDRAAAAAGASYEPANYKKLASPTFIKDFDNKRVQFDAMFLDEWTSVMLYSHYKVSTADKVFISHRPVGYKSSETGLGSSDLEIPPFAMSLPKKQSDIIYEMTKGDIFTVQGLAKKYQGVRGMNPGLEILVEHIEVKK